MLTSLDQNGKQPDNPVGCGLHGQRAAGRWAGSNPKVSCLYGTW